MAVFRIPLFSETSEYTYSVFHKNAHGILSEDLHTVGGVCAQVHARAPAIRKEAMPPYETHVGGTQARALSAPHLRGDRSSLRLANGRVVWGDVVTPFPRPFPTSHTQAKPSGALEAPTLADASSWSFVDDASTRSPNDNYVDRPFFRH